MRGPGDFFGVRQSGMPKLKVAKLSDVAVLDKARRQAMQLVAEDPQLELPAHHALAAGVRHFWRPRRSFLGGPFLTVAVYPGTFDPVHYGHIDIAKRAAKLFDKLIVAIYDHPQKNLLFPAQGARAHGAAGFGGCRQYCRHAL